MKLLKVGLAALVAAIASGAATGVEARPPANCCTFRFAQAPTMQVTMPAAQPRSPGDVTLNPGNPLVSASGTPLAQGCNGNDFEYYDEATEQWIGTYKDTNGQTRQFQHVFYATQFNLKISTLQTNQANLATLLNGKVGRLNMRCNNNQNGCVQFTIGSTTPDQAARKYTPGDCSNPPRDLTHALQDYVAAPDSNFQWTRMPQYDLVGNGYTAYFLNVTSQAWLDASIVNMPLWWHTTYVVVPNTVMPAFSGNAISWVANKYNMPTPTDNVYTLSETNLVVAGTMAKNLQTVVTVTYQVPNQYLLFANDPTHKMRREDEGIAYSWSQFMQNPDSATPAYAMHLPMAKAIVRTMDATEQFLAQTRNQTVSKWIVAGPSKRGWTSYLVAAAVPQRIIGFSSLVLAQADFKANAQHMYRALGGWSFAAVDYVTNNIFQNTETYAFAELMEMESPMSYASIFKDIPKLLICGTGDEFAQPDDILLYWDRFGPDAKKTFRLVPNIDHSMSANINGVLNSLISWIAVVQTNTAKPDYTWSIADDGTLTLSVNPAWAPASINLWQGNTIDGNTRRDFRLWQYDAASGQQVAHNVLFTSSVIPISTAAGADGRITYTALVPPPAQGWVGFYFEMNFRSVFGTVFTSNTGISILPKGMPYEMCAGGDACNGPIV